MKKLLSILSLLICCCGYTTAQTLIRDSEPGARIIYSANLESKSIISTDNINNYTISPDAGAGTGATITITGSLQAGIIQVVTGSGCNANSTIVEISGYFFKNGASLVISPENNPASSLTPTRVVKSPATNNTARLVSGGDPLIDGTTYRWNYILQGY